jgi:hypothetical protein
VVKTLQFCAALTAAVVLSACGGSSGGNASTPEAIAPPPEAGAIATARSCLEEDGYLIKDVGDTWLVVSTRDGSETAHIQGHTNRDGDPYLTGGLDNESVPLGPSALRTPLHKCLAPWEVQPEKTEGSLP